VVQHALALEHGVLLNAIQQEQQLQQYPNLYWFEEDVPVGKIDAVLCNDRKSSFCVVEVKHLDIAAHGKTAQARRNQKRKEGLKQAEKYLQYFADYALEHFPRSNVCGLFLTNESLEWLYLEDEMPVTSRQQQEAKNTGGSSALWLVGGALLALGGLALYGATRRNDDDED